MYIQAQWLILTELTLQKIRAKKELRKKVLERELERMKTQLSEMRALKVILFGSYVQGRVTSSSDLDIICLMHSTKTGKEWTAKIYSERKGHGSRQEKD